MAVLVNLGLIIYYLLGTLWTA